MTTPDFDSTRTETDSVSQRWGKPLAGVVGVLIIVFCLSGVRRGPLWVQNVLFVALILLPIALNVTGWVGFRRAARDRRLTGWRKLIVRWGLLANSLAFAMPWGVILFAIYSFANHRQPSRYEINSERMIIGVLMLSLYSVIAGAVAPGWIRVTLMLNSLIVAGFVLSIPMGVL
jgi:hypothetical protein